MGTVPSPYSPVAGDDATQARVLTWADAANYLLGNATSGGSKRPEAELRQAVAQSIPNANAITAVTFDAEDVDYDSGHSTVTNTDRYTAATAGWHLISGAISFAANTTGTQRQVRWRINGSDVSGSLMAFGVFAGAVVMIVPARTMLVFLNVGDFVQLCGNHDATAAVSTVVSGVSAESTMTVEWRSN